MKLIYSAGNRFSAGIQLQRILKHINFCEVKVAAYLNSSQNVYNIDWTLDALFHNTISKKEFKKLNHIFATKNIPRINVTCANTLFEEVKKFKPDLIICDAEPILANIAKTLNIKLWYCSPLHLLNGTSWERGDLRYLAFLKPIKRWLNWFPKADKYLIYSPFGDIKFRPSLKENFHWVEPYFNSPEDYSLMSESKERMDLLQKILQSINNTNYYFCTGITDYVSDAFYSKKNIIVAPDFSDPETLLNGMMIKKYKIGNDVAKIELMENFAFEELEKSFSDTYRKDFLSIQNYPKLHKLIEEI
jgi:hypothetical protein